MSTMSWLVVFLLSYVATINANNRKRKDERSSMGKYELIDITYNVETYPNTISFKAFGNSYKDLIIMKNKDLIPNNIKHTNGIPSDSKGYFVYNTESCHYSVSKLFNNNKFSGALSICDKRGIRGKITGYNETLIIAPSKYYLDLGYTGHYTHDEEHLVYRLSELNTTGLELAEGKKVSYVRDKLSKHPKSGKIREMSNKVKIANMSFNSANHNNNNNNRRLLSTTVNGGIQNTELLIIADPSYYEEFNSDYDSMVNELADNINYVSNEYEETDWGDNIGTIKIGFKELEYFTAYSGNYAGLSLSYTSSGKVDSEEYLNDLKDYIGTYRTDTSNYDHAMLWTGKDMDSGGVAWVSAMCKTGGSSTSIVGSASTEVKSAIHELGHSFGASHDQSSDNTCNNDDGVMGYGYNDWSFSDCSIAYVQEFFTDDSNAYKCTNDCACLGDSMDYINGHGGSGDSCDNSVLCVTISGIGDVTYDSVTYNLDGEYSYAGCYRQYAYYTRTINGLTWYLFHSDYVNYKTDAYQIFPKLSWKNMFAWCELNSGGVSPNDCKWWIKIDWVDGSWTSYSQITVSASTSTDCDYVTDVTSNPTRRPTPAPSSPTSIPTGRPTDSPYGTVSPSSKPTAIPTTSSPSKAPTSPPSEAPSCDEYNCLKGYNFDTTRYDFNVEWTPVSGACHNGKAYYSGTVSGDTWYLYYSTSTGNFWSINWQVKDGYTYAYCTQDDVVNCNGKWKNYGAGGASGYADDSDAYMSTTETCSSGSGSRRRLSDGVYTDSDNDNDNDNDSGMISIGSGLIQNNNCTNDYGDTVCIYNSGSLWNTGVATFEYNGCKNGKTPFWYYHYTEGNYSITYYLHYVANITDYGWYISEESIETHNGIAYCHNSDLSECTYESWYVEDLYESDMAEYTIDESMGYDSICRSVTTNSDSDYCDSGIDGYSCALWHFKINVYDNDYYTQLCDTEKVNCMTNSFISSYADIGTNWHCDSDYYVTIKFNVSFSSILGSYVYDEFIGNYTNMINENCNDDTSNDPWTVQIVYSSLDLCDGCNGFVSSSSNDNDGNAESGSKRSLLVIDNIVYCVSAVILTVIVSCS